MTDPAPIAQRLAETRKPRRGRPNPWRQRYREDVARLLGLVEQLSERLYLTSTHLGVLSERKDKRST